MKNNIRFGLSKKMLISIIILSACICIASCTVGYFQYQKTISRLYNENGYSIGDLILNQIDLNKIGEYAENWEKDDYYPKMQEFIDNAASAADAKYVYISVPQTDGTMRYIYDTSGCDFGSYDPVSKYIDEVLYIYNTGERNTDNYFVRHSAKYGYLTSSILPVKTNDGKTVALLFVDIAMEVIESTLKFYILISISVSLILTLIFCQLCYFYMNKTVIRPIHVIENCMNEFANNNASITDELNNINTKDELQNLSKTIYSMENTVVKYIDEVTSITAEKERIGAELNVATQIQANMLPSIFPPFPEKTEFDIYAIMHPAKEVGGDFYDFFMIDDTHLGIVMADVSGKGVPAALFMVISKTLLKNRAQIGDTSPAEILTVVNNQLCENNKAEMFVTVWLGILDITTGTIIAANAGHEFPAIKHNGSFELLKDKHGFVLAGMENLKYKDYEIKLEKGDMLFVYTDGVTEATNAQNELFGTNRMIDALNIEDNNNCNSIISNVTNSINDFVKDAPQFDDITMLCLEYNGV